MVCSDFWEFHDVLLLVIIQLIEFFNCLTRAGENAEVDEIVDYIVAAQISERFTSKNGRTNSFIGKDDVRKELPNFVQFNCPIEAKGLV